MTDYDFDVEMKDFPDNIAVATTAAAIETWLDGLNIANTNTVWIEVEHHIGFWKIIVIYATPN